MLASSNIPLFAAVLGGVGYAEPPVQVDGGVTIDWSTAPARARTRSVALVLGELGVSIDTAPTFGLHGGRLRLSVQGLMRSHPESITGDIQVFDNIDGEPHFAVANAFYEHGVIEDRLVLRVGRMDANDTFGLHHLDTNAVRSRRAFLHSSMGFSPTMLDMPSYPFQALGAELTSRPVHWIAVDTGIFDATVWRAVELPGRPESIPFSRVFAVADLGVYWHARDRLPGNVGVGAWYLSRLGGDPAAAPHGTAGPVVGASQTLWRKAGSTGQGVVAFAQYGWADRRVSDIAQHVGLGLSCVGLLPTRSADAAGLGVSAVEVDRRRSGGVRGVETAIEAFYGAQMDSTLQIKPDLQVIVDPGGRRSGRTAVVLTLRLQADL